jgi:hypothetical protein
MDADSFHRLAKSLLDSGESSTVEEALDTFRQYGVRLFLSAEVRNDKAAQTIALTVINAAARSFMGNVAVESEDFVLTAPGFVGWALHDFMRWAGIQTGPLPSQTAWPRICIGEDPAKGSIVPWAKGWRFGLGAGGGAGNFFAPACVAAGGLAVSEAFSILRADNPYAGHRRVSLSLWDPVGGSDFSPAAELIEPVEGLWLVGLGHLGQAYAWTLGFMNAGQAPLFLQDVDCATVSSLSTSVLCTNADVGKRKTRIAAIWLESRGYKISLVERHFNEHMRVGPSEPGVALFGVDNPAARRACEAAGFRLVIDAGLGSGYRDFRGIRVRTFPGPSRAAQLWAAGPQDHEGALAPAYQSLLDQGAERCGVTTLATRAVGAPFVGCVAAAYVIAEYVRRQLDGPVLGFLDMNLRDSNGAEAG